MQLELCAYIYITLRLIYRNWTASSSSQSGWRWWREAVFIVKWETEIRSLVVLSRNRWIDHRHCSFQVDILHILVETTQDITRKNLNSLFHFHFHYRANDYLFICMEYVFIKNIYLSQKLTKNRNNYRLVEFSTFFLPRDQFLRSVPRADPEYSGYRGKE